MKIPNPQEFESQPEPQNTSGPHKRLKVTVYEPESRLSHPFQLLQEMWFDLFSSRELAWQLLIRDISAQYRQSFLGILWAFIPPVITALALTALKNSRIINLGHTDIPYPVYVMFSMSLWQLFSDSVNGILISTKLARTMLAKIKVSPEAFIVAKLGNIAFSFGIQLILIIFLFIWYKVEVSWTLILAPVALIHLLMFATAMGLILGPISVLYGDVTKAMTYIMRGWIFVTPVLYPMPEHGLWAIIVRLNPVTPLLITVRELVISGNLSHPTEFWIASVISFIGLIFGWIFYHISMPILTERATS
ncbi:ABC transporter permease [Gloeothece verrucosa]|uniref:ABC-2 type transporter n=1 Tax=Gloeothece verrucosa (strain PCC 7822) TaxID=497965 RepID=E0UGK0_GLOV7|nr:ABC transporter permease [Gloeothece verrucosa]ADN13209.1 ABC-2 type transporter [Gloeothece verrucosa PCC 7822]